MALNDITQSIRDINIRETFNSIKSNKNLKFFLIPIIVILLLPIVWFIYKYFKKLGEEQPYLINGVTTAYHTKENPNPSKTIKDSVFKKITLGNDYSYSFWIKIDNMNYRYGDPKHIFHKGDSNFNVMNPGVWLHPTDNTLMFKINTFNRFTNVNRTKNSLVCQNWNSQYPNKHKFNTNDYPTSDLGDHNFCRNPDGSQYSWCYTLDTNVSRESCLDSNGVNLNYKNAPSMSPPEWNPDKRYNDKQSIDINNVPIQKWNHFVLTLNNKLVDIYMNGKLVKSVELLNPSVPNSNDFHLFSNGGFGGHISNLRYFNYNISASDVYQIYIAGYDSIDIGGRLHKVESQIPTINDVENNSYLQNIVKTTEKISDDI